MKSFVFIILAYPLRFWIYLQRIIRYRDIKHQEKLVWSVHVNEQSLQFFFISSLLLLFLFYLKRVNKALLHFCSIRKGINEFSFVGNYLTFGKKLDAATEIINSSSSSIYAILILERSILLLPGGELSLASIKWIDSYIVLICIYLSYLCFPLFTSDPDLKFFSCHSPEGFPFVVAQMSSWFERFCL